MYRRLVATVMSLGVSTVASAAALHVAAAASLTDALQEISRKYPERIVFNFGASSIIARQIEAGAPIDVFISADEAKMDQLLRRNLIVTKTRRDILANTLVIVVPKNSAIRSPIDLVGKKIALAQPDSVPAGIYAKAYLQKIGLWNRIAPDVIPAENVRGALAAVESENVDAGIVYKTDALISRAVKIAYEVPRTHGPRIVYPAAVVTDSNRKPAAERFLAYLHSARAREVFRRYGFLLP